MKIEMDTSEGQTRSSPPLVLPGAVFIAGTAILAARLIWEQTVWTWQRGPQMVGFSLAHGSGALLFLFPILLLIWAIVAIGMTIFELVKKTRIVPAQWIALGLAISLLIVMEIPEGVWQRVFINRMVASRRAPDLLVNAAYQDDLGTVRAFVSHGVPIDAVDHGDWRTAMHAAAVKNDTRILRFLVSHGGNVNAVDRSGDSPLELAVSKNNKEASQFLAEHGAQRIQGDEARHQKAIDDKVREYIEEMYRDEGIRPADGRKDRL